MELSGYAYICASGEHWDDVARTMYGDERYAAELLNANPEHCTKLVFSGGEQLYLPVIATEATVGGAPSTPPWKE